MENLKRGKWDSLKDVVDQYCVADRARSDFFNAVIPEEWWYCLHTHTDSVSLSVWDYRHGTEGSMEIEIDMDGQACLFKGVGIYTDEDIQNISRLILDYLNQGEDK